MTAAYQITSVDAALLPPLLLAAVKDHLRIDFSTDDGDISTKIAAAIRIYENKTGQIVNPTEATWNPVISLTATAYASPLQPISEFVALDAEEIVVTSEYQVRAASLTSPAYMVRVDRGVFPSGTAFELTLGYSTLADIPADVLMSIFRIVGKLYENRESVSPLGLDEVPLWMDDLLVGAWVPRC